MSYRHIAVHPTTGALGAEISGVDLRDALEDATFSEIHRAWLAHGVIFFRDQDLAPEQHKAFAARFGMLQIHSYLSTRQEEGHPEIAVFESDASRPFVAAGWHTDMTFLERPPSASVLRGIDVPPYGGDTLFACMAAAHDALSETFQELLASLDAIHDTSQTFSRDAYPTPGKASAKEPPGTVHPVVRTHPETGRKVLFVNRAFTRIIRGLHRRESDLLLRYLYGHQAQPEFSCRFRWQKNSIAVWDNRVVQHRAVADNLKARRRMERVTVEGERPV
jgi:taurine dioxygenase